jgi:hypothetical protein
MDENVMLESDQFQRDAKAEEQPIPNFAVRHYTIAEIAEMWNLSDDAVRKIFQREPGILLICDQKSYGRKRRYTTIRVPGFVLERVHRRLSKV